MLVITAHLAPQPGFREPPVTHHGRWRYSQDGCCFFDAQPAKEPKLDHAALPLVEFRQGLEGIANPPGK